MWAVYAVLLLAATAVSFIYTRVSGYIAFGNLKMNSGTKGSLFIHAIIPLAFAFEIVYQLNPLLTRFGHFFPTLGRQFGYDWEFLDFVYQAGSIKPWQVLIMLFGMFASVLFLKALIKKCHYEKERTHYNRFRNIPILLLGSIYIIMLVFM